VQLQQKLQQHEQLSIVYATRPGRTLYPVRLLPLKVFFQIINYQRSFERPSQSAQIFYKGSTMLDGVLAVQSVLYEQILRVQFVQNEISVAFVRRCKNYDFVNQRELFQKAYAERSNFENASAHIEMHERLVQVEHKRVGKTLDHLELTGPGVVAYFALHHIHGRQKGIIFNNFHFVVGVIVLLLQRGQLWQLFLRVASIE